LIESNELLLGNLSGHNLSHTLYVSG
jgi:hypothetical protein